MDKEGRTARSVAMLKRTLSKLSDVHQPENTVMDKEGRTARSVVMLKGTSSKLSEVCQPENVDKMQTFSLAGVVL